ncbi:MAG: hypothetical protein AAGF95_06235 [Chloroflexota bacterium]
MEEPIQLATCTIDLSKVSEIIEYDEYVWLVFSPVDNLPELKLFGEDAVAMSTWLDKEWEGTQEYEYLLRKGDGTKPQRPRRRTDIKTVESEEDLPF